jgi:hypothetical protein
MPTLYRHHAPRAAPRWVLIFAFVAIFFSNAFMGISLGAMLLVTPSEMRVKASALVNILNGFIGFGLGPMAVAAVD